VRSFSFVGRVELGDLTVTVRPKVAPSELLTLLRYAYSLQDLRLFDSASFGAGGEGLQDLLIAQLEAEARKLLRRGPLRRYVGRSERLASPRGRIDLVRLARGSIEDVATVPCTHHPRSSDFLLNRVVRAGLELGRRMTREPALKRALASTGALYAELASATRLDEQILDSAQRGLDRLSSTYDSVLRLVRILHDSSHLALEQGSFRIDGFMFDMNRFFQDLIGKFLEDSLPSCRVETEKGVRHMMAYAQGYNPRGRRAPTPRPDFVVTTKSNKAYLLDAKYRDLWRTELPREMLYQLAIYAMSQPVGATAAILYPTEDAAATEAIVNISDPRSAAMRARVALRPVVIPRLLRLLREPYQTPRERRTWAEALVLGSAPE
jgi:5-methylcytosine-specific restriction enzyme subunit McrC